MEQKKPIIIIKKKVAGHGGHHGGAWKVAYADFVTAMMALFIVLWLMNTSTKVQEAVAGYFRDPAGVGKLAGTGIGSLGPGQAPPVIQLKKEDMKELQQQIEKALKSLPDFDKIKNQVELSVTPEGLRIELIETEKGMFFESGNARPTLAGTELLITLAQQLGKLPNRVQIEGHTDARPYIGSGSYSNWELSTDRANQARILMQANGLHPKQVQQVRGFADQDLRDPAHPDSASNRRISMLVPYLEQPKKPDAGAQPAEKASDAKHEQPGEKAPDAKHEGGHETPGKGEQGGH
jgi:chemotaxis protein MotB